MVDKINTVDRPHSVAMMTAIEDVIDEIAPEKMTAIEVIGVLEVVKSRFYDDKLSIIKFAIEEAGI